MIIVNIYYDCKVLNPIKVLYTCNYMTYGIIVLDFHGYCTVWFMLPQFAMQIIHLAVCLKGLVEFKTFNNEVVLT